MTMPATIPTSRTSPQADTAPQPAGGAPSRRAYRLASVILTMPFQMRTLVLSSFVSSMGVGLFFTGSSVYFVRSVGLSVVEVGAGLSLAGLLGLAGGLAAGFLSDRFGASTITIALRALTIPALLTLTQVRSFWAFLIVTGMLGMLNAGSDVSRSAWVSGLVDRGQLNKISAYNCSAFNAGFSLGLLGAGAAIAVNTRPAYLCLFAGNAAATAVTCLMLARLPRVRGTMANRPTERSGVLRDFSYMLVAQVSGMTRLGDTILTIGLPLWIITHTTVPGGLAAWLISLNTVVVVLFQSRMARRAGTLPGAGLVQRWAFAVFALTCLIVGFSSHLAALAAALVLLAATLMLTVGEMWGEAAWWALRYGLAPSDAQGRYGGVFMLGQAVPTAAGPVLVTTLTTSLGSMGWLLLAGIFLGCASFSRRSVTWAERAAHKRLAPG